MSRKYMITITDSKNEHIKDWRELYADSAKDAAEIIERARRGKLDQIYVYRWGPLTNEYGLPIATITAEGAKLEDVKIPNDIKRACTKRLNKYESQDKYDAANTFRITIKLNRKTEKDIIEWLNRQDKKQTAIKALVRAEIRKEEETK